MTDEPFTDDQNIVFESGIPVRLYSGGANGGPSVPIPPVSSGDPGDVLTINPAGTEAEWLPPSGSSDPTTLMPASSTYWLAPSILEWWRSIALPVPWPITSQSQGELGYGCTSHATDTWVVASGGSATSAAADLPVTLDGAWLSTARAGYDFSRLGSASTDPVTYTTSVTFSLVLGGTVTNCTVGIFNGDVALTAANAYCFNFIAGSGTTRSCILPHNANTTSTAATTPRFKATWTTARTWELQVSRVSFIAA